MMVRASTPCASKNVAAVCRRSWNRMSGSSAFLKSALNAFVRLLGSKGVPMPVGNTKPLSRQREPAASLSSSWPTRWERSAETTTSGSATVRRDRADFGSTRCHRFSTRWSDARTWRTLASKSTASHFKPRASPWRKTKGDGHSHKRFEPMATHGRQQRPGLIRTQRLDLVALHLWRLDERRDIAAHDSPPKRLAQCRSQNRPRVLACASA